MNTAKFKIAKGNLLIVDDEPDLLKSLKTILGDCANTIFTACDGNEALKVVAQEEIHCIISDINMPAMNGIEFLTILRKNGNQVPFIIYTSYGNHDLLRKASSLGVFDFLDKPNIKNLEEVVRKGLESGFDKKHQIESELDDKIKNELLKKLDE